MVEKSRGSTSESEDSEEVVLDELSSITKRLEAAVARLEAMNHRKEAGA